MQLSLDHLIGGGASVKLLMTTQDICAMKRASLASYVNPVSSQVDSSDGDVDNMDYVTVVDSSRKYEDCQRLEAPAPEPTVLRYSDDDIDHQPGVAHSKAHSWSVSGRYSS